MSASIDDLGRMTVHLRDHVANLVDLQIENQIKEFAQVCESPIEILFGVAFHFTFNSIVPAISRRKLIYLFDKGRSHEPLVPDQWKIVAQHNWQDYRIDFAIFTRLPYPIFVECDGHDFHERTKEQAARDREKDRRIQAAGIPILRFTGSEIYADPQDCALQVYNFASDRIKATEKTEAVVLA